MKILLVTTGYPWPPRRGLELRALQFAEWLAAEHAVTLLAPAPGARRPPPPPALPFRLETYARGAAGGAWGLARASWRGWPAQAGLYARRPLAAAIRQHAAGSELVILQLVRLAPHLAAAGATPLAVDLIDSLGLSFRRRAVVDRPWRRWLWRLEAGRLERWEREMVRRAVVSWVVSERDRDHVVAGLAGPAAARLQVLPPGVEVGKPAAAPAAGAGPVLAVTGNLGYFATAEGLRWWLDEVWPLARAQHPGLRLLLAGARPPAWLRRARSAQVTLARDPADLQALLAGATIAVVPARAGAGVPVKILEAWAAGVPVIAHPWSAAGARAQPGQHLLTAATPAEWLAALGQLLGSPAERSRLAVAGRERLRAGFAPAALADRLRATVRAAAEVRPRSR